MNSIFATLRASTHALLRIGSRIAPVALGLATQVAPTFAQADEPMATPLAATSSEAAANAAGGPASAKPVTRWSERLPAHLDFEVDPLAFAAKGFSLHAGIRWHHFRADLGVFGMELPGFMLKDDRFTTRFAGFGGKLDYRFFGRGDGPFVGVSGGRARVDTLHNASGLAESHYEHDLSARVGYQFDIYNGFYAAPWVGVGYKLGAKDVTLDGDTIESSSVIVFPTMHLGYRFQ